MAFSSRVSKTKAASPAVARGVVEVVREDINVYDDCPHKAVSLKRDEIEPSVMEKEKHQGNRKLHQAEKDFERLKEEEQRRKTYEVEKARQTTIASSKAEAARRAGGGFGSGRARGDGPGFAWKSKAVELSDVTESAASVSTNGRDAFSQAARQVAFETSAASLPSQAACEEAVSAMISRTIQGMRDGLEALGLPSSPLIFEPGRSLVLCGHNVREEINEMIHAHMSDERTEFNACLVQLRAVVSKPLLTKEEVEMMDDKEMWVETEGPSGQTMWAKRGDVSGRARQGHADMEDGASSGDEVVDVDTSGRSAVPEDIHAGRVIGQLSAPACESFASPEPKTVPNTDDYYTLLGVGPDAPLHEIRSKFRQIVLTHHPERGGDPIVFQKFSKAYSVLSDPAKRQEYDGHRVCER